MINIDNLIKNATLSHDKVALNAYKKALVLEPNNPDIYNSMADNFEIVFFQK